MGLKFRPRNTRSVCALPSFLYLCGLVLFTKGFFLTRLELRHTSKCTDVDGTAMQYPSIVHSHCSVLNVSASSEQAASKDDLRRADTPGARPECDASRPARGGSKGCWSPRLYDRLVFIVIDAWRYDFAAWNPRTDALPTFTNRMPLLAALLKERPQNAALYKFVADAPTVTMQRLKGLTAGSLPTFIDLSSNFASSAVEEDNVMSQARAHWAQGTGQSGSMVFMGDDTWASLFPSLFHESHPFPSFDVKDLHTVDSGVTAHLGPTLRGEGGGSPWAVVVAHFLGVDHAGHRYHESHPSLANKLGELDSVLAGAIRDVEDVVCPGRGGPSPDRREEPGRWDWSSSACSSSALLVVLGDHGMTKDGNHGGATAEETHAALVAVSIGRPLLDDTVQGEEVGRVRVVNQVDLVPSLALACGLPIPHANLGALIHGWDWRERSDESGTVPLTPRLSTPPLQGCSSSSLHALSAAHARTRAYALNAFQVSRYTAAYASVAPSFASAARVASLHAEYTRAMGEHDRVLTDMASLHRAGAASHDGGGNALRGGNPASPELQGQALAEAAAEAVAYMRRHAQSCAGVDEDEVRALVRAHAEVQAAFRGFLDGTAAACRALWTQFDVVSMVWGIACVLAGVLLSIHAGLGVGLEDPSVEDLLTKGREKEEVEVESTLDQGSSPPATLRHRHVTASFPTHSFPPVNLEGVDGYGRPPSYPYPGQGIPLYIAASACIAALCDPSIVCQATGTVLQGMGAAAHLPSLQVVGRDLGAMQLPSLAAVLPLPPAAAWLAGGACLGYMRSMRPSKGVWPGKEVGALMPLSATLSRTSCLALLLLVARLWCLFTSTFIKAEGTALSFLTCAACAVACARVLGNVARLHGSIPLLSKHGTAGSAVMAMDARTAVSLCRAALLLLALATMAVKGSEYPGGWAHQSYGSGRERLQVGASPFEGADGPPPLPVEPDSPLHLSLLHTAVPLVLGPTGLVVGALLLSRGVAHCHIQHCKQHTTRIHDIIASLLPLLTSCAVLTHWHWQSELISQAQAHVIVPRAVMAVSAAAWALRTWRYRASRGPAPACDVSATCHILHSLALLFPGIALVLGPWSPSILALCCIAGGAACGLLGMVAYTDAWAGRTRYLPIPSWLCATFPAWVLCAGQRILTGHEVLAALITGALLPGHAFAATGHRAQFSSLAYASGFVGLTTFNFLPSGGLLALNTFGPSHLLMLGGAGSIGQHVMAWATQEGAGRRKGQTEEGAGAVANVERSRARALIAIPAALCALCTCIFVAIERRHLMVWAVFAPKYLFDAVGLGITLLMSAAHNSDLITSRLNLQP